MFVLRVNRSRDTYETDSLKNKQFESIWNMQSHRQAMFVLRREILIHDGPNIPTPSALSQTVMGVDVREGAPPVRLSLSGNFLKLKRP